MAGGITFSAYNLLEDASPIIVSSEKTTFPGTNTIEPFRSLEWQTLATDISDQYIIYDLGYQASPTSLFITNEQRGIQLSQLASIKLQASDDGNWTTPVVDQTITWNDQLITFYHATSLGHHRFWRLFIDDDNNPDNYLAIGNVYLGESLNFNSTGLKLGWAYQVQDDSDRVLSDGGEAWFDKKAQKARYSFELEYMTKAERDLLEEIFFHVGQHRPFYIQLDPTNIVTSEDAEWAIYCRFTSELKFTNPFLDAYSTTLTVEEVV